MTLLLQLLANGFVSGCNTALLALSFAIIYNTTRTFHIAHGAVYTVGAYICYVLVIQQSWPLIAAVTVTLVLTAILGTLMEILIYAPLARRNASLLVGLLTSLGLYVTVVNIVALIFGNDTKLLRPGVEEISHVGPIILTHIQIVEIAAASVLLPAFVALLKLTAWGKIIRAVRDNSPLAALLGVNVDVTRIAVFAVGSALAAITATLRALDFGIDPQAGMPALLTAAVAVIVGGVGTFEGPVIGGFLLGVLQGFVIWFLSARWTEGIIYSVLVGFLLFRPNGIAGRQRRLEESWE